MKRTLFVIATCLALAACASIPLGTLWKLRGFDEDTLVRLEPTDLRAALNVRPAAEVTPGSVELALELQREGASPERHAFGLVPGSGPGPSDRSRTYSVWQLDDAGRQALADVQRQLRAAQASETQAYSGATFSVNFRPDFGGEPPASMHVSVQLLLDPEDGWMMLIDEAQVALGTEPR